MSLTYTHGREFASQVRPLLERHDVSAIESFLQHHWPETRLLDLLDCGHEGAVKVALICLGLRGRMSDTAAVARFLHDDDPFTAELAEHALWSIWLRAGDETSNADLCRAVGMTSGEAQADAIALLCRIIDRQPDFAEAHNQLAIALFLAGDLAGSIESSERALGLNPYHFAAMANLGHCHASQGQLEEALGAYYNALELHPRMEGIRESIAWVRRCARHLERAVKARASSPLR